MFTIALLGAVVTVLCILRFPVIYFEPKFAALALITVLVGSQITIKIPGARGQIAVSDTFIFLAILMFGIEAAVGLRLEAFCSSVRFSRKAAVLFSTPVSWPWHLHLSIHFIWPSPESV